MFDSRQDLRSKASEVGISFGAVQLILTNILGMSGACLRKNSKYAGVGMGGGT